MGYDVTPAWLQGPLGQAVLASETDTVQQALAQMFGVHFLQLGCWGAPDQFLQYAQTRHRSLVDNQPGLGVGALSRSSRLAIASDSIDVLLLPHTLEMDPEPHQVLREVDRVLVGEGHLLVLGFNPLSAWGLRHAVSRGKFPHGATRVIPEKRMRDWLSLLGMEVSQSLRCVHALPVDRESVQRRLVGLAQTGAKFWPRLAGVYILVAQKRVYSATPIRPQWHRKSRVVAGGLVKPTTRSAA